MTPQPTRPMSTGGPATPAAPVWPARAQTAALHRQLTAEFAGTGLLVAVVVGSGITAQQLTPDTGLQLLANSAATVLGIAVLIAVFGPASGAHFNPIVSAIDWLANRHDGGLAGKHLCAYIAAQTTGGLAGAILANLMFGLPAIQLPGQHRASPGHLLGEVVATAGLIFVIVALARTHRAPLSAVAVAGWIGTAYWFTSSTSFANPAVTLGRAVTDTFAGIAPASVPWFIAAQITGGAAGLGFAHYLYPPTQR